MITRICDRCGQPLEQGALRYVAKIQVFAAYDPLEITFEDLMSDHSYKIKKVLEQCKDLTEEELIRDVFVDFQFDLCHACQRAYITDPLPAASQEGG